MKLFIATMMLAAASIAQAASIPANLEFPIKNAEPGAVYRMTDHPNGVFVFETYQLFCGVCNDNAPNVDSFAKEFAENPRVQILDTGLDTEAGNSYKEWIRRHAPNHPVIADPKGVKVFNPLKSADRIPQVFVVNCKGEMIGSHIGIWDSPTKQKLRGYISKALEATCE